MITTLLAVLNGIVISNIYSSLFTSIKGDEDDGSSIALHLLSLKSSLDGVQVGLICPKSFGKLTVDSTGNVICLPVGDVDSYNLTAGYCNLIFQPLLSSQRSS
jgi:hypothetical protein